MRRTLGIITTTVLLLASGHAQAQAVQPPASANAPIAPEAQAAQTLQTCFLCHGEGGVSRIPTRPTIAGQKIDYVARQLQAFKRAAVAGDSDNDADNKGAAMSAAGRSDPIMAHMAETLDDAQISYVAAAVSKLACDGRTEKDRAKAASAAPPPMPPAAQRCASCHGDDGIGRQAHVPNVAGQQRAYLRRQLLLIREIAWGAAPRENESWRSHPIMERQAARISIEDVDALAQYYAALDCRGAQ